MPLPHPCLRPVLVLSGIAAFLAGCRDNNNDLAWWRNERQKTELNQHLEVLKYRLAMRSEDEVNRLAALHSATARNRTTLSALRTTKETLTGDILNLRQQIAAAAQQAQQRNRANAIGQHFDSLTVARGRTFHDVSVQNIRDAGVSIRHAHGTARLRYSVLSNEQRIFFGLTESSALAAERKEAEATANYERLLASQARSAQQTQQKQNRGSNKDRHQIRRPFPSLITNQPERNSPLIPSATTASPSTFRIWRSRTRYHTPTYHYYGPVYRDALPVPRPLPRPKPKNSSSS